jgi:hypothetical protein
MLDPDPHKTDADPKHCFQGQSHEKDGKMRSWGVSRVETKMPFSILRKCVNHAKMDDFRVSRKFRENEKSIAGKFDSDTGMACMVHVV